MATVEFAESAERVRRARLALQRDQRELEQAERDRRAAEERQSALRHELARIDRSLNLQEGGQMSLGGPRQGTFATGGGQAALRARRKHLLTLLQARPDPSTVEASPPPGYGRLA